MEKTRLSEIKGAWRLKRLIQRSCEIFLKDVDEEPASIFDYDWDYLFILDACRYDVFKDVLQEEEIGSRVTMGSNSRQFIRKNFSDGSFDDLVYISGNGFFDAEEFRGITGRRKDPSEIFGCFFNAFRKDWDEEYNTVLPEDIIEDIELSSELFSDKKVIAHFMQPHLPLVGSSDFEFEDTEDSWDALIGGDLSREEFYDAYKQNLIFVLEELNEIIPDLDGKIMITADHGNMFGKMGFYKHPSRVESPGLRKVPMHEVDGKIEFEQS